MKLTIIRIVIALSLLNISSNVLASASDGVSCSGSTASYSSDKVLKCYIDTTRNYELASVCPPAKYPLNVVMHSSGQDTCMPVVSGNRVSSAMTPPLPGYPPLSSFSRKVSNSGVDKFVAQMSSRNYKHPRGNTYFHNASKGVICPSGYSSKYASGRLKCEKKTIKRATCDFAWKLEVRPNSDHLSRTDVCLMGTLVGTITGEYTIPEGTTGLVGNPRNHGWILNSQEGRDNWYKVTYTYPQAAR